MILIITSVSTNLFSQVQFIYGNIKSLQNKNPILGAEIYEEGSSILLCKSKANGYFEFLTNQKDITIVIFSPEYNVEKRTINTTDSIRIDIYLEGLAIELGEISVSERRSQIFEIQKLDDVVGTSIYAAKKSEVIILDKTTKATALNNARQIYSQVSGLNIYQNDDAGLQLNIGGRGLDPNRTSNFNTRQNGYDISADALGYPESYYTPPSEAVEEIQLIRGAASLQFGPQFGGLINFKLKEGNPNKPIQVIARHTVGSYLSLIHI